MLFDLLQPCDRGKQGAREQSSGRNLPSREQADRRFFMEFQALGPRVVPVRSPPLENGLTAQACFLCVTPQKHKENSRFLCKIDCFLWLRGKDSNQRPPGYESVSIPFMIYDNFPQTIVIQRLFWIASVIISCNLWPFFTSLAPSRTPPFANNSN